jgi:hypothetical protein
VDPSKSTEAMNQDGANPRCGAVDRRIRIRVDGSSEDAPYRAGGDNDGARLVISASRPVLVSHGDINGRDAAGKCAERELRPPFGIGPEWVRHVHVAPSNRDLHLVISWVADT